MKSPDWFRTWPAGDSKGLKVTMKPPFVISLVGSSGAGKTTLIKELIQELNERKHTVAVVKRCPHGFDMDKEGKDSWQFKKAGARGVAVISSDRIGLIREMETVPTLGDIAEHYFPDYDIVLGEGFGREAETTKIVIQRKGIRDYPQSSSDKILAVVSDSGIETDKPVFKPDDVSIIVDFIEEFLVKED